MMVRHWNFTRRILFSFYIKKAGVHADVTEAGEITIQVDIVFNISSLFTQKRPTWHSS